MLDRLMAHSWPGNARELRNTIERAVILCPDGAPLDAGHLPQGFGKDQALAAPAADGNAITVRVGATVDEAERLLILRTLEATGQNKTRAAEILGVSLKTLHNKLKEYSRARKEAGAYQNGDRIASRQRPGNPRRNIRLTANRGSLTGSHANPGHFAEMVFNPCA